MTTIIGYHIIENYEFFQFLPDMQAGIMFRNKSRPLAHGAGLGAPWERGILVDAVEPSCVLPDACI